MKISYRRLRAIVAGAVLGVLLGAGGVAVAENTHSVALWNHGCGDCRDYDGHIHPYLSSTDGAARRACVGWGRVSGVNPPYHSPMLCPGSPSSHIHFENLNGKNPEGIHYAQVESSQTGLGHHHHCHHSRPYGSC